MELVKKNLVSIICGLVAILAVGALFWPIKGYYEDLNGRATKRAGLYGSLKGLKDKPRDLPQLGLESTETAKLEQFPTKPVIEYWQGMTKKFTDDAHTLFDEVVKMNQHAPLVPGALPNGSANLIYDFRAAYKRAMDVSNEEAKKQWSLVPEAKIGFKPTEQQISDRRTQVAAVHEQAPGIINQALATAEKNRAQAAVKDEMYREVASKSLMYMDATALDPYQPLMGLAPQAMPDATMLYVAQLSLWVQEDVLKALAEVNKGSPSVANSPVKHLLKIKLVDSILKSFLTPAPAGSAPPSDPNPATPWQKDFTQPNNLTGRTTNGVYDVLRFDLTMNVEAEQVPRVLQALSRNRLITVTLISNMAIVDTGKMQMDGYYYGDKPVVQLSMKCETLLLRSITEPLMPRTVRLAVGLPENPKPVEPAQPK